MCSSSLLPLSSNDWRRPITFPHLWNVQQESWWKEPPGSRQLDRAKFNQNRLKFSVIKVIDYVLFFVDFPEQLADLIYFHVHYLTVRRIVIEKVS